MATGVKPRDEDTHLTRNDLEAIQDAMKSKKFRDLLSEYCEEVRDPANQELYQKEMTQLEKERGYDITFINPKAGYVIKTSVAGDRKAFINICSNENVGKPSYTIQEKNGQRGMNWKIPYTLIPPREDFDHKRQRAVIYDVVFHSDTLRMAVVNKKFRELVNHTAIDGLQKSYDIHLDNNNIRFPKSYYKGMSTPAVIRKEDPNYKPSIDEENEELAPEILEKLYPQQTYKEPEPFKEAVLQMPHEKPRKDGEYTNSNENGYTTPKYVIKQQKNVDLQDFTNSKDSKQYTAIPSHIVIEVNLPLLSSTKDCILDVQEKSLSLISEKPAKYKLNLTFPYLVSEECGNAKFDKSKHMLIVTLPVLKKDCPNTSFKSSKLDSGVESEENSGSQSDEDNTRGNLVVELSSTKNAVTYTPQRSNLSEIDLNQQSFLESNQSYVLPSYTYNVLDDIVAFTFHVKNTEPDSVQVNKDGNKIYIKFTTVGSGFVPVHYAAILVFDENIHFINATGEAWDNNVILQLELDGDIPLKVQIGLHENSMTSEYFEMSQVKKTSAREVDSFKSSDDAILPSVEVTNLGMETSIVVSSNHSDYDEDDLVSPASTEKEFVETDSANCESSPKSILRKPIAMTRSFSESSYGDVASSMDYISSDCIQEESSFKKTVRFNGVIAKQFYRYNSSIEGQKKKNQRKKSKRRNQNSRKSESEAEDEATNLAMPAKLKLKPAMKQRRDSGLADTSDAELENRTTDSELKRMNSNDCMKGDESAVRSVLNIVNNNEDTKTASQITDDDAFTDLKSNSKLDEHINENISEAVIADKTKKSVLNIVDNNNSFSKSQPAIWNASSSKPIDMKYNKKSEKDKSITCDNIKHNTDLYNPEKLNKGQYLEVTFKNDLIFDLDM